MTYIYREIKKEKKKKRYPLKDFGEKYTKDEAHILIQ